MSEQLDEATLAVLRARGYEECPVYDGVIASAESLLANGAKTIWVVTAINHRGKNTKAQRTWGWYSERAEAVQAVLENRSDLFELYYNYCLIERFCDGVFALCVEQLWFYWDSPEGMVFGPETKYDYYRPIKRPDWAESIINWGMG